MTLTPKIPPDSLTDISAVRGSPKLPGKNHKPSLKELSEQKLA
jgi:hypothetical protein